MLSEVKTGLPAPLKSRLTHPEKLQKLAYQHGISIYQVFSQCKGLF